MLQAGEVSLEQSMTPAMPDSDRKCLRAGNESSPGHTQTPLEGINDQARIILLTKDLHLKCRGTIQRH